MLHLPSAFLAYILNFSNVVRGEHGDQEQVLQCALVWRTQCLSSTPPAEPIPWPAPPFVEDSPLLATTPLHSLFDAYSRYVYKRQMTIFVHGEHPDCNPDLCSQLLLSRLRECCQQVKHQTDRAAALDGLNRQLRSRIAERLTRDDVAKVIKQVDGCRCKARQESEEQVLSSLDEISAQRRIDGVVASAQLIRRRAVGFRYKRAASSQDLDQPPLAYQERADIQVGKQTYRVQQDEVQTIQRRLSEVEEENQRLQKTIAAAREASQTLQADATRQRDRLQQWLDVLGEAHCNNSVKLLHLCGHRQHLVRLRAPTPAEAHVGEPLVALQLAGAPSPSIQLRLRDRDAKYCFDHVLNEHVSNQHLFNILEPLVTTALHGHPALVVVDGPTNSGKSYTMLNGPDALIQAAVRWMDRWRGDQLGEKTRRIRLEAVEVYLGTVRDLLAPAATELKPVYWKQTGPAASIDGYRVDNASTIDIQGDKDVQQLVSRAIDRRKTAATKGNKRSSRGFVICSIHFDSDKRASLRFVDLPGSEERGVAETAQEQKESDDIARGRLAFHQRMRLGLSGTAENHMASSSTYQTRE